MVQREDVDFDPKHIDENFLSDEKNYPVTGEEDGLKVRAGGVQRMDDNGKPYPTKLGIHGTTVAIDWDGCIADGACMDVCPVDLFEWKLNPGNSGTGNDKKVEKGTPEWEKYRTDKSNPVRESECIFCMACVTACPWSVIKVNNE
jgi:NAD-dependent dihydropyrimidine dehydrogenase PreA subunit